MMEGSGYVLSGINNLV